jgi:hypothetical protein
MQSQRGEKKALRQLAAVTEQHPAPALPPPSAAAAPAMPASQSVLPSAALPLHCRSTASAMSPVARRGVQFPCNDQLCTFQRAPGPEGDDPPCAVPSSTAVPAKPALRKRVRSDVTAAPDDAEAKRAKPTPAAAATLSAATPSDAEERLIAVQLRLDDAQQAESRSFFIPRARDHDSCLAYVMANAAALRALLKAEEEHAAASQAAEKETDARWQQASAAAAAAAPLPHESQEDDPHVRALIQSRHNSAAEKHAERSMRLPPSDYDDSFASAAAPPLPVGPTPLDAAVEQWRLAQLHVVRTTHTKHLALLRVNKAKAAEIATACHCPAAAAAAAAKPGKCRCRGNPHVRLLLLNISNAESNYGEAWEEQRAAVRAAQVAHSETVQLAADPSAAESAVATSSPQLSPVAEQDDLFSLSLRLESSDDEGDALAEANLSDDEWSLRLHSSDDESDALPAATAWRGEMLAKA